jgi:hypothetical protein
LIHSSESSETVVSGQCRVREFRFVNVRNFGNPEEADRRNLVMKFLTKIPSTRAIFSVQKLLVLRFDKNCCGILVTDSLTKF